MLLWLFYLVKDISVSHIPSGNILGIILLPLTWMQLLFFMLAQNKSGQLRSGIEEQKLLNFLCMDAPLN